MTKDLGDDAGGQQEFAFDIPRWDDTTLVAGIRRGDASALREFCERFRPVLLDQARRFHIPPSEREETVMEFLDDIALKLAIGKMPYALPSFVIKAFRNRLIDRWRSTDRLEQQQHNDAADDAPVIAGACSEFSWRAAQGSAVEHDTTSQAVETLVTSLLAQRTSSEREMLTWMSYHVPLRDVADWLGISYTAAKVRWCRLRAKMHKEVETYLQSVSESERRELERRLPYDATRQNDLLSRTIRVSE